MRQWNIIGVGSGWGARDMGTADGARVLLENMPPSFEEFPKTQTYWHKQAALSFSNPLPLSPLQAKMHTDHVLEVAMNLCSATKDTLLRDELPLVFGGDHSIAIGTWSGIKTALDDEDIGLIWVDAHMDSHTPETSPSLNVHGMPVAVLLGHGDLRFTSLGNSLPKLKPENICLIGVRSFEKGEEDFLRGQGVKVYQMKDIQQKGFTTIFEEARREVPAERFGLSIDIDAFDPEEAPGTGTPEASGLRLQDVKKALYGLAQDPRFLGLEMTEFNPHRDINNKTCHLMWELASLIKGDIS